MPLLNHAQGDPLLIAFGLTSAILCLNLLVLWVASGVARAKAGVAINSEDGARFNVSLSESDPPAVARVLRAHRNAEAIIYPFLWLALVFVLVGGASQLGTPLFALFVIARLAHSGFYLAAKQPWRTISFVASLLIAVALLVADVWVVFRR